MHKNKKADWNWLVGAAIATLILVITVFWIGRGTSEANTNLKAFQDCKARGGECKASESECKSTETPLYKALGCGDEKDATIKDKPYCCLPLPK
jgi:hypothetical protein